MSSDISFKQVSKSFGDVLALDDFNLEIVAGETVALIGTSGSGKTTALKLVNRLIDQSSGEIRIDGKSISSIDVIELRRSIGYVIQKGGLFPHMTVAENIGLLSKIEKRDEGKTKSKCQELLELVSLPPDEYYDRYPAELSGGQQQRVSIARALAFEPELLLMDEPFGALDPITRNELHDEFMRIEGEIGTTTIIVTHDINEAFKLADRLVLLDQGQTKQIGTKDEFLNKPADDFVKRFVEAQTEGGRA